MGSRWSEEEMLVSVYLYRFGPEALGLNIPEIARLLERSEAAIKLRLLDIKAIESGDEKLAGFGRSMPLVRAWEHYRHYSKDQIRESVLDYFRNRGIEAYWVPGKPSTFATRGEVAWKQVMGENLPFNSGEKKPGVSMVFFLKDFTPAGQPVDVDNFCEPVFSVLAGTLGWFKRRDIKWWKAEKVKTDEEGMIVCSSMGRPVAVSDNKLLFCGFYSGKLPRRATDSEVPEWLTQYSFGLAGKEVFDVSFEFTEETVNIGDIATGKVKALLDCLYPILGGVPGRPEDWRVRTLYVSKGIWSSEVPGVNITVWGSKK